MIDFAFIRFENVLQKALESNEHAYANILYYNQIRLSTQEVYVQISNHIEGISFEGNWDCFVADLCGKDLYDITDKVIITEFTDNKGKKQIIFLVENIVQDFGEEPVIFKIKHNVSGDNWYSNPLLITDNEKDKTTLFHYRDYGVLHGIAYNRANVMQIIRLSCFFVGSDAKSTVESYTDTNGNEISSRVVITDFKKYKFININEFTYLRFNRLMSHSVKYIDYIRATNSFTVESGNYLGRSNLMELDFKSSVNLNEDFRQIGSNSNIADYYYPDYDNTDYFTN